MYKKWVNILSKNEGFKIIENISNILGGKRSLLENLKDLEINDLM